MKTRRQNRPVTTPLSTLACLGLCLSLSGCAGTTVTLSEDDDPRGSAPSVGEAATASGITATEGGLREIGIRWPKPPDAVRKYRVERATARDGSFSILAVVSAEPTEYVDRGLPEAPLADSTAYYYRISPESRDGLVGVPSDPVRGMTAPPPEPPKPVRIEAHKSRGIRLKWEATPSPAVTGYAIRRTPASDPDAFKTIATVPGLEYEDGGTATSELRDSAEYLYRITAVNRVGSESKPALFPKVLTMPPPRAVLGLAGTSREVRCVPLTWSPSPEPDVVRYDLYRSEKKDADFAKIASLNGRETTRHLDGGANPGNLADCGTYYYRIRAINAVTAESVDSDIAEATTREEPPVVEKVVATPACPRRVPLSWQISPDDRVIGYEIWRASENEEFTQIAVVAGRATTRHVDHGGSGNPAGLSTLKDDATYKYKIVAFNYGQVRSSASQTVTVRTKKRPDRPLGLARTTHLPHAINVTWKPNPESDIVEFEIQVSDQADGAFKKLASVMPPPDAKTMAIRESALDNAVSRFYRIKAIDRDRLESDWSEVIGGKARPLPPAPTGLGTSPVLNGTKLAWEPVTDPPIREYGVWKHSLFGSTLVGRTEKPEFVFLNSDLARPITISVSAVDHENLESGRSQTREVAREVVPAVDLEQK